MMDVTLPAKISESADTKTYCWDGEDGNESIRLLLTQPFGRNEVYAELQLPAVREWEVSCYEEGSFDQAHYRGNGKLDLGTLKGRGASYVLEISSAADSFLRRFSFHTLFRYPYERTFEDYKDRLIRKDSESRVILYWEEDVDVSGIRKQLEQTRPGNYLDHIIHSITTTNMAPMERAKAIVHFLGNAIQHNAVYMNKADSIPAMDRFLEDGSNLEAFELEAAINLELGFTRCGFINGFIMAALCGRAGLQNEVFFSNGGHTSGKIRIGDRWYLSDVDAYKRGVYPLTSSGGLPSMEWLYEADNRYHLDTVPGWADSNPDEGWIDYPGGFRITGLFGGGRHHSETGYTSAWFGAKQAYPPSVPIPLQAATTPDGKVLLEWIGSYDRDGDFRDYQVEAGSGEGLKDLGIWHTTNCYLELAPFTTDVYWRVRARDWHAKDTPFFKDIYYTPSKEQKAGASLEPYADIRINANPAARHLDLSSFTRREGFDDVLGQTNLAKTELFDITVGFQNQKALYLSDPTNYWFNGAMCRSLWTKKLDAPLNSAGDWEISWTFYTDKRRFGGERSFPFLWIGEFESYTGVGLILDCGTGNIHFATNFFGDWRKHVGAQAQGKFQTFQIAWNSRNKNLIYSIDSVETGREDCSLRVEPFVLDAAFIGSNPEGELECIICDLSIAEEGEELS